MIALVREISPRLADALVLRPGDRPADAARARGQHATYVDALRQLGADVRIVAAEPTSPDDCFIEDTVVVAGATALLTRPGAPRRRAEVDGVARALPPQLRQVRMTAPATLDGGDVLRVGRTLFVGLSGRTNEAAVDQLTAAFAPEGFEVVPIAVPQALHLKCHASPIGDRFIVVARDTVDPRPLARAAELIEVDPADRYAANVVAVGGTVLVAAGFAGAERALRARAPGVLCLYRELGLA